MIVPGQKFHFLHDETEKLFTIIAVSPYVPMVKIDGGWVWISSIVTVEPARDSIDDALKFLGLEN